MGFDEVEEMEVSEEWMVGRGDVAGVDWVVG